MSHVHLIIGPVGAGKSTYALQLLREHPAVFLNLDAWMTRLFGEDQRPSQGVIPWYLERRDRCVAQIWDTAEHILDAGTDVILEIGLLQAREREAFYARIDDTYPLTVHVVDADRDLRRARVQRRNIDKGPTFSVEVPPQFFELASDMWESPENAECEGRTVRFVS